MTGPIPHSDDEWMEDPQGVHASRCAVWTDDGPCDCEGWRGASACREADPDVFFPDDAATTHEALAICHRCTVRQECSDFADQVESAARTHVFGIYGGETALARHRRRRLAS